MKDPLRNVVLRPRLRCKVCAEAEGRKSTLSCLGAPRRGRDAACRRRPRGSARAHRRPEGQHRRRSPPLRSLRHRRPRGLGPREDRLVQFRFKWVHRALSSLRAITKRSREPPSPDKVRCPDCFAALAKTKQQGDPNFAENALADGQLQQPRLRVDARERGREKRIDGVRLQGRTSCRLRACRPGQRSP